MRTWALRTLIGSIAISALVGIYVLAVGRFGEVEARVLVTALSVSALSILVMACGAAYERGRFGWVPHAGALVSLVSFVLFMIGIWSDSRWEPLWKTAATLALAGTAAALSCLLSLAALARKFLWTRALGIASAFLLAAQLSVVLWLEIDEEAMGRLAGVLGIVVVAVMIGVPVLHRMSALEAAAAEKGEREPAVRFCVACGGDVSGGADEVGCDRCGARFRVELSRANPD